MEEIVYLNGALIPRSEARVSVFDYGFLYGYGLFETMRAYKGKIFLLERHIERLLKSAGVIGISVGLTVPGLGQACMDTLKANSLLDARIRLTVSRGEADAFPGFSTDARPTVVVTARQYQALSPQIYDRGFKTIVSSVRRYSQSPLSGMKSANYLASVLAKTEAEKAGRDEALFLNEKGFITEGSVSNVFFADASGLVTPPVKSGLLPGITREVVMELAALLKINVTEADVSIENIARFNEAFLTNSIMEIMPLVEVADTVGKIITIGQGKPGKITRRLMATYKERVARETK